MNWQHSASSPLTCPHPPNLWFIQGKHSPSPPKNSCPSRRFPASILFILPPSSKSLVDMSRFWQNGPASQHVRKEPAKNKFLVNFCFELTAQHLFSSDLLPSSISLVYTRKALPVPPHKNPVPQDNSLLVSYLFYPHPPIQWLIRGDFVRMGQPVNTPGRNQLKTSF